MSAPVASVVMPTYRQAHFIRRALESLLAQTLEQWELAIVSDDPDDGTADEVETYLSDPRIRLVGLPRNVGLGAALNVGLDATRSELVAYLPSDDVFFERHLESLRDLLETRADAALAFSEARRARDPAAGEGCAPPLQLVQVMHRRTDDRWLERDELTTDDLDRMLWSKLRARGAFVASGETTCEWVDHPLQRHKIVQERPRGGLNPYRRHYGVREPLVFEPSVGNRIDERELYAPFLGRARTPRANGGLTILLVGELAYNPERVLALAERGHRLVGLWTPEPWNFNSVGPLPFGGVEDLPFDDWRGELRRLEPDVIYALLNWQAVPFAHEVMRERRGIPFVWHFKEEPFLCIQRGTWPQLRDLYRRADGRIYSSAAAREWFARADRALADGPSLVLDGDLPKAERLRGSPSTPLSESDGEVHTVVPGRPVGLDVELVGDLARQGVHLHLYGAFQGHGLEWLRRVREIAHGFVHEHELVGPGRWVSEFSQYDAGWLHVFRSDNGGDVRRATWDDLNLPARIPTLLAAGVPLVQRDNEGSIVAAQSAAREADVDISFADADDLGARLRDAQRMERLRSNAWRVREQFSFDHHADRVIEFFRSVIASSDGG